MKVKFRMILILSILVVIGCWVSVVNAQEDINQGVYQKTNQIITTQVGKVFEVKFVEPTGYTWSLFRNPSNLELINSEYQPNPSQRVGAHGTRVLKYKITTPGKFVLKFNYRKPWSKEVIVKQLIYM